MDQQKIGCFLKELRHEKHLTQEQLAAVLKVSNRSVSRWENGVNMPDFALLIEIAAMFEVGVEELLDGERKKDMSKEKEEMTENHETKETMQKVADYHNHEKMKVAKRLHILFLAGILALIGYMILEDQGFMEYEGYAEFGSILLGFVFGMLLVGALYTSRYMGKIKACKMRLLHPKS